MTFTKPVEPTTGHSLSSYAVSAFTHPYHAGYGGPEIEQHKPEVKAVALADDGLSARITLDTLRQDSFTSLTLSDFVLATRKLYFTATRSTPSTRFLPCPFQRVLRTALTSPNNTLYGGCNSTKLIVVPRQASRYK